MFSFISVNSLRFLTLPFFKLRDAIHAHANKEFPHLKAVSYRKQVVNGTNYIVKVHAGDEHIHVKFHKALPVYGDQLTLSGVELGQQHDSPL